MVFTTDTYSHIIEGVPGDAVALLDEVFPVRQDGKHVAGLSSAARAVVRA